MKKTPAAPTSSPFDWKTGPSSFASDPAFNGSNTIRAMSIRVAKDEGRDGWGGGDMGHLTPGKRRVIDINPKPFRVYAKARQS